ncbi:MAG: DUF3179 domain-containing protein [Pseudomonadota bacterium]
MKSLILFLVLVFVVGSAHAQPGSWQREFPLTDWQTRSIEFDEILSGGPPRDGIPSIDAPTFRPVDQIEDLGPDEPVLSVEINGDARAYPLRVMTWHEIVNDTVGGEPVAVTYCPLCNSGIVFERTVDGMVLDFGTTGRLRNSDLVMYDRQTETWWQQFLGEGIIGAQTGVRLTMVPARLESWSLFAERHPGGQVLVPNQTTGRAYGRNPYVAYDSSVTPFLYRGDYDGPGGALSRVVAVGDQAWLLSALRESGSIESGDLVLTWTEGQNSALDTSRIDQGRDVGNVVVQRRMADGSLQDVPYDVPFAFAFAAFYPDATIHATSN